MPDRAQLCVAVDEVIGYLEAGGTEGEARRLRDALIEVRGRYLDPSIPDPVEALTALVDAIDAVGEVTERPAPVPRVRSMNPEVGARGVVTDLAGDAQVVAGAVTSVAGAVTALALAVERARAVLRRRPAGE